MSYRETKKYKKQCAMLRVMRTGREDKRLLSDAPDYPVELPHLRKRITVENFDFGYEKQVMELYKTNRNDCFEAHANGKLWNSFIGLSRVLEWIRKANPRVKSLRK